MNISETTREYAQTHNARFSNSPNETPISLPKYMTRLQTKIWSNGQVILPSNTCFDDVINLAIIMQQECPYIHRYANYNTNGAFHSLTISLNNANGFTLIGLNIDLYRFITSSLGFNIMSSLWDDNFILDEDEPVKLSKEAFHKSIKIINSFDNCPLLCSICQGAHIHTCDSCITKCKHTFHTKCLEKWTTEFNHQCPNCRQPINQP